MTDEPHDKPVLPGELPPMTARECEQWARLNYRPGDPIPDSWWNDVRATCEEMDQERQITTTLDDYVYTSDHDVLEGDIEQGRRYTEEDFNRIIEIKEREKKRVEIRGIGRRRLRIKCPISQARRPTT